METVVVAIIVGAFGGLLGSLAGPVLTHRLAGRQRREQRREEMDRELRRMLEGHMRLGSAASAAIWDIHVTESRGGSVRSVFDRYAAEAKRLQTLYPDFAWRPNRIADEPLQRLAIAHAVALNHLQVLIGVGAGLPVGSQENWSQRASDVQRWVDGLAQLIDHRMDELGW